MRSFPAAWRFSALRRRVAVAVLGATGVVLGAACSGSPDGLPPEAVGSSTEAITGTTILSRADEWVTAKLLYCQSPNGAPDPDPSCPSVCNREKNAAWDPYRSDCSGFVSWAWGLPAPGNTTDELAPADTSVSYAINGSDLQPGDALNIPGDHIILFVSWITPGSEANFYEEPGCSASPDYAHAFSSTVSISGTDVTVTYEGATFTAIRYTGLTGAGEGGAAADAGTPCTVTATGAMGDCLDTSACASLGGTSTADYCPGPANIQCCTGIPDAGSASSPEAGSTSAPEGGTSSGSGGTAGTGSGPGGGRPLPPGDDSGVAPDDDGGAGGQGHFHREGSGCSAAPVRPANSGLAFAIGLGSLGLVSLRRRRRRA